MTGGNGPRLIKLNPHTMEEVYSMGNEIVFVDMSVSLDGYVTGPNDSRDNPFATVPKTSTLGSVRQPPTTTVQF